MVIYIVGKSEVFSTKFELNADLQNNYVWNSLNNVSKTVFYYFWFIYKLIYTTSQF